MFAEQSPAAAFNFARNTEARRRRAAARVGLNRFNKEHSRRLATNDGWQTLRNSRLSKVVALPASYCRRLRNDVSVSVSMEASHRVRVVSIVIQREDYFANPP